MYNENEVKSLHEEFVALNKKINEEQHRMYEIDAIIAHQIEEKVASRFIPLERGDKIRVQVNTFMGKKQPTEISTYVGLFGEFRMCGYNILADDMGESRILLFLYKPNSDGTMSTKYDSFPIGDIVNIEKI